MIQWEFNAKAPRGEIATKGARSMMIRSADMLVRPAWANRQSRQECRRSDQFPCAFASLRLCVKTLLHRYGFGVWHPRHPDPGCAEAERWTPQRGGAPRTVIDLRWMARLTVAMRILIPPALLLAALLGNGCGLFHYPSPPPPPAATIAPAIVTPDNSLTANVISYNPAGRFVVLGFPVGRMPRLEQGLFLYRNGLKVAEVKVTGPQRDNNIVADLITGEAQVGDEVRDQ
jgi:hypothetical protein